MDADYPYIQETGTCDTTKPIAASVEYYVKLPANDANAVAEAIANVGPLTVAVDASNFHMYQGGIFDGCSFNDSIEINHAVTMVGYGHENGVDYWLIRNSWGEDWGEEGYMRLKREPAHTCGVDEKPADGSGCTGSPDEVTVCGTCGVVYDVVYPVPAYV